MSKNKLGEGRTPGEWTEGENRRVHDQWGNTIGMAFTVVHSREVPVKREVTLEEQEANRRLFAKSPLLVEARDVLTEFIHDGKLQSFEDRERFRLAARALLDKMEAK